MKFKKPRQNIDCSLFPLIMKEMKRQRLGTHRLKREHLEEIESVSSVIQKKGLPDYLVLRKLPGDLGKGVFLRPDAKPLKKGQLIAPYAGKVSIVQQSAYDDSSYAFAPMTDMVLNKQEQQVFDKRARYHPKRLYSLNLDAQDEGNFTRFVNHSDQPNVIAHLVRTAEAPIEVIYFVKKTIHPGEQLLVCYEDDGEESYWGVLGVKPDPVTPKTFMLNDQLKVIRKGRYT